MSAEWTPTLSALIEALTTRAARLEPDAPVKIVGNQRWWDIRVEDGDGCVLLVAADQDDPYDGS